MHAPDTRTQTKDPSNHHIVMNSTNRALTDLEPLTGRDLLHSLIMLSTYSCRTLHVTLPHTCAC